MLDQTQRQSRAVAAQGVRPGAIILTRHGEPALSRRCRLTSAEYRAWWAEYEEGGLLGGQNPPACLLEAAETARIFHSTRRRAAETARAVAGEREVVADAIFIEAPLPPPRFPDWIRFSPRMWGVIARFWWWMFDHHDEGEETRDQAKERARRAAQVLVEHAERGEDVLVLAHGFFNGMVGVELGKLGWRCVRDQGFRYWSARRFEKR